MEEGQVQPGSCPLVPLPSSSGPKCKRLLRSQSLKTKGSSNYLLAWAPTNPHLPVLRRFLLFPTLGVNLGSPPGTRTGKEETRACCGVSGGRPEIAATEGAERFPGNLRVTVFATGDSQLSKRKPRAQLVRQCHVSMAARGRPRRSARTPLGDGWAPRRFERNRTTKAPRRAAEGHLPGRGPEPRPPRAPPPSRPGASLFPAFGAQGPPWPATPRPPVGACTRAGAAREPGLETEAGGGVLSPRATRARPTAASAHDACAGLLAPSENRAFRVRTGCKVKPAAPSLSSYPAAASRRQRAPF